jgi:hypothetical protein
VILFEIIAIPSVLVILLALYGSHRWPAHRTGLVISAIVIVVLMAVEVALPQMMQGW